MIMTDRSRTQIDNGLFVIIIPEYSPSDRMALVRACLPAWRGGPKNPLAGRSFNGEPFVAIALEAHERLQIAGGRLS